MADITLPGEKIERQLEETDLVIRAQKEVIDDNSFEQQAQGAFQLSQLNSVLANSRTQFLEQVNNRINTPTSENGQPNFPSLVSDVGDIGNTISAQQADLITDSNVKKQFILQFGSEVSEQQIKSKQLARQQQLQYMEQSFMSEQASLVQSVQSDPYKDLDVILGTYHQKLKAAQGMGLFTEEQNQALYESFRSQVSQAKMMGLIELDPQTAQALMESNPEETGLNESELVKMQDLAFNKLKDNEIALKQQEQKLREQADLEKQAIIAETDDKIKKNEMRKSDFGPLKGYLSESELIDLKRSYNVQVEAKTKSERIHRNIIQRVINGDSLESFTPGQIEDSWARTLENVRETINMPEGQSLTLSEKASLARQFKGRIKSLEFEMEHALEQGEPEQALQAINAYRILAEENPEFIKNLHSSRDHAGEIANYALMLVDKTGIPEQAAIQRARETILNSDDIIKGKRNSSFRMMKAFRESLESTAREYLGGDPWFGFNRDLAPGVAHEFHSLARESYQLTGDGEAAAKSAANQMKRFYGETGFNGGRLIMFAPPEKMVPGVSSKDLMSELEVELKKVFPKIDASQVEIVSDDITNLRKGEVSYGLQIRDEFDNIVPLQNPGTGELLRWSFNPSTLLRKYKIKEAQNKRQNQSAREQISDITNNLKLGDIPKDSLQKFLRTPVGDK